MRRMIITKDSYAESPLTLAGFLHGINLDILVTSAFLRSFTLVGEVIIDGIPQSLIAILAKSAGANLTYVADEALCRQHGFSFLSALARTEIDPVCLSSNSLNLEFVPKVHAGFEGLGEKPLVLKVRTPDQYLSRRKNISWLAMSTLSEGLLLNSESTVAKDAPLISGFVGTSSARSILDWCSKKNYTAVTNTLTSLDVVGGNCYCWLVPSERMLENVRHLLFQHSAGVHRQLSLERLAEQAWPELLGAGDKLAVQAKDFFINKRRWYYLDKLLSIGLYPMESDGESYWRWMGERGARFFLPLRARGHYTISFDVFSLVSGVSSSTIRCFVNGKLRVTQQVNEGDNVKIPHYASRDGGLAELYVVSEQSRNVDGKNLSMSYSSLIVQWESEFS